VSPQLFYPHAKLNEAPSNQPLVLSQDGEGEIIEEMASKRGEKHNASDLNVLSDFKDQIEDEEDEIITPYKKGPIENSKPEQKKLV